jgi:ubiquinone/menaquinone biosynthesis C-methylase UbiE
MSYNTFFSKQARQPSGLFGRFFSSRIFDKGNVELNSFVRETLAVESDDRILEIGSGPGAMVKTIADSVDSVVIEAVDFSKPMIAVCSKRNKKHIRAGKVKVHLGDFNHIPFGEDCFDIVFTVNTIYFWENPEATLAKICRELKPGGRLVIGFHAKDEMEQKPLSADVFRYYSPEDVIDLLQANGGFSEAVAISRDAQKMTCYCAVGTK